MQQQAQVVVVGGGYAGVAAANRLSGRGGVSVTLVNPRPVFVERIRLHQLAAGTDDAIVEFGKVLAPSVQLVVDAQLYQWLEHCRQVALCNRNPEVLNLHNHIFCRRSGCQCNGPMFLAILRCID